MPKIRIQLNPYLVLLLDDVVLDLAAAVVLGRLPCHRHPVFVYVLNLQ